MPAVAIVQARMRSTRLPGKVLLPLGSRTLLEQVVERASRARGIADVVVATSTADADEPIRALCAERGIACFAGSEDDVLDRYHGAAARFGADPILRLTADCPCLDPALVEAVLERYARGDVDYVACATGLSSVGVTAGRFPEGLSVECVSRRALDAAWREADEQPDHEHVTRFVWTRPERFPVARIHSPRDLSHLRLTVDHPVDYDVVAQVFTALGEGAWGACEAVAFLEAHPEIAALNAHLAGESVFLLGTAA